MPEITVDQWMIDTYETNVLHDLQQRTSRLEDTISIGSMSGKKRRFNYIGEAEMDEITERNGDTNWTEDEFFNRWIFAKSFAKSSLIEQDEVEQMFTDPQSDMVKSAVMAGFRKKDDVIINTFDATAYIGEDDLEAVVFPTAQILDIQTGSPVGSPANQGINLAKLEEAKYMLDQADIDPDEKRYMGISAFQLKELLRVTEITNADYAAVKALVEGKINTFLGFEFRRLERFRWASDIRDCFAWTKESIKFAISRDINTKTAPVPEKNFNIGVQTRMRLGATRLFDKGVVKLPCKENH